MGVSQYYYSAVICNTLTPELLAKKNLLKARATGKWTEDQQDAMARIWRQWEDENASHSLPLERPRKVAEAIMDFIRATGSIHH